MTIVRVLAILGMSMLPALAPSLAGARVVTSYYSDQIIITTDETWDGPVDTPPQVGPALARCWHPPRAGDQVTVQLSFRRDGAVFGSPRINFSHAAGGPTADTALRTSILAAVSSCTPLPFTPRLGANIAGQVFVVRFIAPR